MISSRACLMCVWSWCHSACDGENWNKKLSLGLSDYKMIHEACEWLGLCCLPELPVLSGSSDLSRSLPHPESWELWAGQSGGWLHHRGTEDISSSVVQKLCILYTVPLLPLEKLPNPRLHHLAQSLQLPGWCHSWLSHLTLGLRQALRLLLFFYACFSNLIFPRKWQDFLKWEPSCFEKVFQGKISLTLLEIAEVWCCGSRSDCSAEVAAWHCFSWLCGVLCASSLAPRGAGVFEWHTFSVRVPAGKGLALFQGRRTWISVWGRRQQHRQAQGPTWGSYNCPGSSVPHSGHSSRGCWAQPRLQEALAASCLWTPGVVPGKLLLLFLFWTLGLFLLLTILPFPSRGILGIAKAVSLPCDLKWADTLNARSCLV